MVGPALNLGGFTTFFYFCFVCRWKREMEIVKQQEVGNVVNCSDSFLAVPCQIGILIAPLQSEVGPKYFIEARIFSRKML